MTPQPWEAFVARPYDVGMPPNYDEEITRCSRAHPDDIDAAMAEAAPIFARVDARREIVEHELIEIVFGGAFPIHNLSRTQRKAFATARNAALDNPLWRTGNN